MKKGFKKKIYKNTQTNKQTNKTEITLYDPSTRSYIDHLVL